MVHKKITAHRLVVGACVIILIVFSSAYFLEYLITPFWQMDFVVADADCDLDQYNAIEKCNVEFEMPEWMK